MLPLDTSIVAVADRSDDFTVLSDPQNVSETEIVPALISLGIHAGFERRKQRATGAHVGFQLSALLIAEESRVGQDQGFVFPEILRAEVVFVDELEKEAAFEQGIVDAVDVLLSAALVWRFVEQLSALAHYDAEICNWLLVKKVFLVFRQPIEVLPARFVPAAVLTQTGLASDEVIPGHHTARYRFVHPHLGLLRTLRDIAPAWSAG